MRTKIIISFHGQICLLSSLEKVYKGEPGRISAKLSGSPCLVPVRVLTSEKFKNTLEKSLGDVSGPGPCQKVESKLSKRLERSGTWQDGNGFFERMWRLQSARRPQLLLCVIERWSWRKVCLSGVQYEPRAKIDLGEGCSEHKPTSCPVDAADLKKVLVFAHLTCPGRKTASSPKEEKSSHCDGGRVTKSFEHFFFSVDAFFTSTARSGKSFSN